MSVSTGVSTGGGDNPQTEFCAAPPQVRAPFPPARCGQPLCSADGRRDNSYQDTTHESTPGQRRWNADQGPRRPIGHDRLMDTIATPSDGAPAALCPACGRESTAGVKRLEKAGVSVADYKCTAGHIWITKWMVAA